MTEQKETEETAETKIVATHRLQASGLWDEATVYRTARRVRYRDVGLIKKTASENAWADMMLKFSRPGVDSVEPPEITMPEPVLPSIAGTQPEEDPVHIPATDMDVAGDIAWAYEHLGDEKIRADQAPSGGSWNMLIYAREARHKFLELVTKYDQSGKGDDAETKDLSDDSADHSKAISKLAAITEQVHYEAVLDAVRQSPGEVERALRKSGWTVARG